MKYATAVLAATLLFSGAAFAQSLSGVGQYHKDRSNLQSTSATTTSAVKAEATAPAAACGVNGSVIANAGTTGGDATQTADMNANAKCSAATPQAAPPATDPGPKQ